MQSRIRDLPYGAIMAAVDRFKKEFFTRPWPSHAPSIEPETDSVESILRDKHFEGVYLSYRYKGQVLDFRRAEYDGAPKETHVRMNKNGELIGHFEYSRYEEKKKHINANSLRWLNESELWELLE